MFRRYMFLALILGSMVGNVYAQPDSEFFAFDNEVRNNFSIQAHKISNVPLYGSHLLPLAVIGRGAGDSGEKGRVLSVYSATILSNLGLTYGAKYFFRRPRPYTHNPHQTVQSYASSQGDNNTLSFYSGHASASFSGAAAGSLLGTGFLENEIQKKAYWGLEFAMASSAAVLRIRAGKHYYTDVVVGAIMGIGVGVAVPQTLVESDDLSQAEVAWALGGTIIGGLSYFLPFPNELSGEGGSRYSVTPYISGSSMGLRLVAAIAE